MNIEETKDFYHHCSGHRYDHFHEEHAVAMKRKRTKRQQSYLPVVTTSSSSGGGGASLIGDETYESTTTEEEEDMANCLILLARSGDRKVTESNKNILKFDSGTGFYGYDCKTCNRNFPTFQALGGHRASHKKPKSLVSDEKKSMIQLQHDRQQQQQQNQLHKKTKTDHNLTTNATPPLLHGASFNNKSSSKIHECSICGSEFSSGQALGGHMRRHRTLTTSSQITTTNHHHQHQNHEKHETGLNQRNVLSLDLNLPAPEDGDDDRSTPPLFHVFPAPALIHCHN